MLRRLLPLALAGVLLACGGGGDVGTQGAADQADQADTTVGSGAIEQSSTVPTVPTVPTVTDPAPGSVVAPQALRFSAPLIGGGDIELTTLAGRPVLLWFWAPW